MIYYKKINLKCLIELQQYLYTQVRVSVADSNIIQVSSNIIEIPDTLLSIVNSELNSYSIPYIDYCRIYRWPKNSVQSLHVDGSEQVLHCAINIPLHGGEHSKFQWFDGDFDLRLIDLWHTRQKAYSIKWNSPPRVAETVELINGAYLIRIDRPHQAISSRDSSRCVFTMRFKNNPTFEELYERLPSNNI